MIISKKVFVKFKIWQDLKKSNLVNLKNLVKNNKLLIDGSHNPLGAKF